MRSVSTHASQGDHNVWSHLICGLYCCFHQLFHLISSSYLIYSELKILSSVAIYVFAFISCIICMLSSSIYHDFNSMSPYHYLLLLKVDLIGISIKITGLSVTLIYKGFHYFSSISSPLAIVFGLIMTSNLLLQLTPCYMHDAYEKHRLLFYVILIISLF